MVRAKKDPNLATVTYNAQNVERAIGYFTALLNAGDKKHDHMVSETIEYYSLSPIEAAMLSMGTANLVAPQFRNKGEAIAESQPVETLVEKVTPKEVSTAKPAK